MGYTLPRSDYSTSITWFFVILSVISGSCNGSDRWTSSCPLLRRSCNEESKIRSETAPLIQCSCSPLCSQRGDCCTFAPTTSNGQSTLFQCVQPSLTTRSLSSYYMIASCPDEWNDDSTRILCGETLASEDDPLLSLPVTSMVSNATYRNIYCAVCNADFADFASWRITGHCNMKNASSQSITQTLAACRKTLIEPPLWNAKNDLRACNTSWISSCPENSIDQIVAKKCLLYTEPVKGLQEPVRVFKNRFCAECRGVREDNLLCLDLTDFQEDITKDADDDQGYRESLFFQIDQDVDIGSLRPRCSPGHVQIKWFVDANTSVEHLADKCLRTRKLPVRLKRELIDVLFVTGLECSETETHTNYTLDRTTGHAFLQATGKTLKNGSYSILPNSSLLACSSPEDVEEEDVELFIEGTLSTVCSSLSLVGLFLKVFVFFWLPEPRTIPNKSIIMLSVSLFVGQFLFMVALDDTGVPFFCVFFAALTYYLFVVAFLWINVLSYDICAAFSSLTRNKSSKNRFMKYNIYAWGLSFILTIILVFAQTVIDWWLLTPEFGHDGMCWFTNEYSLLVFIVIPLAMVLVVNFIFFSITVYRICRTTSEAKKARGTGSSTERSKGTMFFLYVKLAFVMGLTWILGFIAAFADSPVLLKIFIVLNGLKGVIIFLEYTNFKLVFSKLKKCCGRQGTDSSKDTQEIEMQEKDANDSLIKHKRSEVVGPEGTDSSKVMQEVELQEKDISDSLLKQKATDNDV